MGAIILLPTQWVLPCCTYDGIIVNIPKMRLFYYRHSEQDPHTTVIHTFPVGLGRDDWRTPTGKFRVRGKTVNPTWIIPESIRQEHIAERGDARRFIPGGDPQNPLGKYRLELTTPTYAIHGTDIPLGVGMKVSHGCVRLYPEDIERLFPLVPVGTPGEFIYQPVRIGTRGGIVYAETHRDIYGYVQALDQEAKSALERLGLSDRVDQRLLQEALADPSGRPIPISPEPSAPAGVSPTSATEPNEAVEEDVDRAPRPGDGETAEGR